MLKIVKNQKSMFFCYIFAKKWFQYGNFRHKIS